MIPNWIYYEGVNTRMLAFELAPREDGKKVFVIDNSFMYKRKKPDIRILSGGKAYRVWTWGQNGRLTQVEATCVESDDKLSKLCLLAELLTS